jgi:molecular chaperone HscB
MTAQPSAPPLQVCYSCGSGAPVDAHFCPQCSQLLALGRRADYFAFLGLPRKLDVAPAELEQRFRALSRQFHPDYFYNASSAERRASLERSSYLNDAYRTLRQPSARLEYLLGLEGFAIDGPGEAARHVSPALLEEVFALNEELNEIRDLRASGASTEACRARLERARLPIEAKQAAHEARLEELSERWDAWADAGAGGSDRIEILSALRDRVLERNYINNLLAAIARELSQ